MIIYLAGNITDKRESLFIELISDRLFSYYHHRKEFKAEFKIRIKYNADIPGRHDSKRTP